jgi:tetratricopeptide (TPR) repeat protein
MTQKAVAALLFALLLLAPRSFSQTAATRQQQIDQHKQKAGEYLRANKPELAIPEFKAIVALDPKNVDALGNLGVVLYFQGDYAGAIPNLRAALKLKPDLWKIVALLGIAEKQTGDVPAARADLEKAFPNVAEEKIRLQTGTELIDIYTSSGELDKAATVVSAMREMEPTDEALLYTAYRLYSDLAEESLLSLSLVNPNSARLHQAIAHELAKRGDSVAAIQNYREALKIDPKLPGLHFELAEMLSTVKTPEAQAEAETEYRAAIVVNPSDAQAECRLGDIAAKRNDLQEAQEVYAKALSLQPNNQDAAIGLAKVLASTGQPEKAAQLLEHAIETDPTSSLAHFRLSTVYRQLGRAADAQRELEQYQKYKTMKEKLRDVYRDLHLDEDAEEKPAGPPSQ